MKAALKPTRGPSGPKGRGVYGKTEEVSPEEQEKVMMP
jgi:hypothetical protein